MWSNRTLLREHEMIHMDRETGLMMGSSKGGHLCTKCGRRFFRGGIVLRDHIAQCDGQQLVRRRTMTYKCLDCERKFGSKVKCAQHMADVHNRHIENIAKFCFECKRQFDEEASVHAKRQHCAYKCDQVRLSTLSKIKFPLNSNHPQCGARFFNQKTLENHSKKHESGEERPFACELCSSSFKTKNHLSSHISIQHKTEEEKQFACSLCSKRFAFQFQLTAHSNQVHSDVKRFGCNFCDMKFKALLQMKEHCRREHGEVKAYPCPNCDAKLKTLNELKTHQKDEHGKSLNVQKYHDGS